MIQMTCPFCKREFPYDNGKLDREISEIGQRIAEINKELSSIKCASRAAQRSREGRRKVLILELSDLMVKISGLKAIRKAGDQQIKAFEYMIFKEIVKDRYGEKAYHEILEAVEQELQAYKASGLMRHEYTRSGAKSNVTSINKL